MDRNEEPIDNYKTTLAKELQKKLGHGTLRISQDVIRREMLWVKDGLGTNTFSLLLDLIIYGTGFFGLILRLSL